MRALVVLIPILLIFGLTIWLVKHDDGLPSRKRLAYENKALTALLEQLYLEALNAVNYEPNLADRILHEIRHTPPFDTDPRFKELK
jgi:hypothetical protein